MPDRQMRSVIRQLASEGDPYWKLAWRNRRHASLHHVSYTQEWHWLTCRRLSKLDRERWHRLLIVEGKR